MQSSPVHGLGAGGAGVGEAGDGTGFAAAPPGNWHTATGVSGVHASPVGIGTGGGAGCPGAGLAEAFAAKNPAISKNELSTSVHHTRRRRRPRLGRMPAAAQVAVEETAMTIAQAPTIPLRISTTSGASAASP
jgi:hypothetical protein